MDIGINSDHEFELHLEIQDLATHPQDTAIGVGDDFRYCVWELKNKIIKEVYSESLAETTISLLPELADQQTTIRELEEWGGDMGKQAIVDGTDELLLTVLQSVASSVLGNFNIAHSRRKLRKEAQDQDILSTTKAVKKTFRNQKQHCWTSSRETESPHQSAVRHFSEIFRSPDQEHRPLLPPLECNNTPTPTAFMNNFSSSCVWKTVKEYPDGKSPGNDNIPNILLATVGDQNHPFIIALSNLLKLCALLQRTPTRWNHARVLPLPKSKSSNIENSRPIALTVIFRRLFERCLLKSIVFKNNNDLSQSEKQRGLVGIKKIHWAQAAFRSRSSTLSHITVLHELLIRGIVKYLLFLDYIKAYDTVSIELLLKKLGERIGPACNFILTLVRLLFTGTSISIIINGIPTVPVEMKRGLLQGSVLSPILFNIFLDDLATTLQPSPTQAKIVNLLFADDIVIFSDKWEEIPDLAETVVNWSNNNGIAINPQKSGLILPPSDTERRNELALSLQRRTGINFPIVSNYKYLGIPMGWRGILWCELMSSIKFKTMAALRKLRPLAITQQWSEKVRLTILKIFVLSRLQYPAGLLWAGFQGFNSGDNEKRELDKCYKECVCWIFGIRFNDQDPPCGMSILHTLSGLPSLDRMLEEFGARLQSHFNKAFGGSPISQIYALSLCPPWSAGVLIPRLQINQLWKAYCRWADIKEMESARIWRLAETRGARQIPPIRRPELSAFILQNRQEWIQGLKGTLPSLVLPTCRHGIKPGHDYILNLRSAEVRRWATRWRRGVFAFHTTCPVCKSPFRISHVARCSLLSSSSFPVSSNCLNDDRLQNRLHDSYGLVEAALNNRKIADFRNMMRSLCVSLKVSLDDV